MPFNDTAMVLAATAIQDVALYGQLHSGAAGDDYTDNVTTAGRELIAWAPPTGTGDFILDYPISFTGGEPDGPVNSLTVWSADADGTCYGEFLLDGDHVFDSAGTYAVTAFDATGTAADSGGGS